MENGLGREEKKTKRIKLGKIPAWLKVTLSLIVVLGLAFGAYRLLFPAQSSQIPRGERIKVVKGTVAPFLSLTGQVVSLREVSANFETAGKLKAIYVKVGERVKKGQKLARIDDSDLKRKVKLAKVNLDSARARLSQLKSSPTAAQKKVQQLQVENALDQLNKAKEDLKELKEKPGVTEDQLKQAEEKVDQAEYQYKLTVAQVEANNQSPTVAEIKAQEAAVEQARASYEEALEALDSAILYSPADGTVVSINGEVGEQVGSGSSLASSSSSAGNTQSSSNSGASLNSSGFIVLADLENLEIKASVDQADISRVRVGQDVSIEFDALPDKVFKGKVSSIDPYPVTSQNVVTYYIHISLSEKDSAIKLGMTANLKIDLGRKENVLVVPNMAIRTVEGKKYVTKVVNGLPVRVSVETGLSDERHTEILSGLAEGDEIEVIPYAGFSSTPGLQNQQGEQSRSSSGFRPQGFGPMMGR